MMVRICIKVIGSLINNVLECLLTLSPVRRDGKKA